ncbi:Hypp3568 [Branchiostoma lanceolatum]|uniref:Hypp3568 protein n=2 Tax=Branchiostoma lanceolatum TaxID=7740 RepID=A0A8K0A1C7_BRALA|nr:Hypp3568 [Branchiostoma lanceolatum]
MRVILTFALHHRSSEAGHLHLGIYNMAQLRPVTDGDSVRALFSTNAVEEAGRSGRFTLVSHTHVLVNQHEETVFRLTRKGLYPKSVTDQLQVSKEGKDQNATQSELRDKIIRNVSAKENMNITASMPLTPNELYVHRLVKAFSPTETKGISNLMRATHPHIFNTKKFCMDDILVPGPMALAATVHNVADDFGDVLYETVVEATNPNRVNQEDVIGSVSFILDVQRLPQNSDLEEVTVRTLGIKNLDMDELLDRNIPVQLFTGNNMESTNIEKICEQKFPLLCRRIAVQVLWKFLRLRPSQ